MKLKRATPTRHFPRYTTQGRWMTADGRFTVVKTPQGWRCGVQRWFDHNPEYKARAQKDIHLIHSCGLKGPFKTRAAALAALTSAVAALTMALADQSEAGS